MIVGLNGEPLRSEQFIWHREVPQQWTEQLEATFPRQPNISWLELGWVPGTPDSAIQRFIIYEATPGAVLHAAMKEQLHEMATNEDRARHTTEEARILDYWLEHNALLRPFWVIQGEHGGHKYRFDKYEARQLRLMGLPDEPPLPGDLPYAPFDNRVLEQLVKWDLLRKGYADLKSAHIAEKAGAARDWRRSFLGWLHQQLTLENVYQDVDIDTGLRKVDHDAMPSDQLARIEEHYVKTGRILPHRA